MYIDSNLTTDQLGELIKEQEELLRELAGKIIMAEGGLIELRTRYAASFLYGRGISCGDVVLVDFKNESGSRHKFVKVEQGRVQLRRYTESGRLSSSVDDYPIEVVNVMRKEKKS